jgi:uncharacterized protein YndB with AHSA1/START domain
MKERSAQHNTFVIERKLNAAPARVFKAWADPAAKMKWFASTDDEWTAEIREMDFRVGGRERVRGTWKSGHISDFQCTYFDIVPDQRIVYVYDMYVNDVKISVSLGTIEVKPSGSGTQLKVTEQGVFLDGYDDAGSREHGTNALIDRLTASLGS